MLKLFGKKCLKALLALLLMNSTLMAYDSYCPEANRIYIGGFGGGLYSDSTKIIQTGTAFFSEAEGGPLAVDARGHAKRKSAGFGGAQIGYEWRQCPINLGCSNWNITPGAEIEAFFYRHNKKGDLINPTLRLPEHDFLDTFPMNVGVYMGNLVLSLNSCYLYNFTPYVSGGIGAANLFIRKAKSLQVAPAEIGINHFNSDRSDSAWAFAAQAKAGLRYNICNRIHLFGEYRFLYVDSSCYTFGSTMYPTHVPTTTWNVKVKDICYNAFAFGLQFDLQ